MVTGLALRYLIYMYTHAQRVHEIKQAYARFYQLGLNLGIAILRSEDNPRFILGLSFGILSTFSDLRTTNLGIFWLSL